MRIIFPQIIVKAYRRWFCGNTIQFILRSCMRINDPYSCLQSSRMRWHKVHVRKRGRSSTVIKHVLVGKGNKVPKIARFGTTQCHKERVCFGCNSVGCNREFLKPVFGTCKLYIERRCRWGRCTRRRKGPLNGGRSDGSIFCRYLGLI